MACGMFRLHGLSSADWYQQLHTSSQRHRLRAVLSATVQPVLYQMRTGMILISVCLSVCLSLSLSLSVRWLHTYRSLISWNSQPEMFISIGSLYFISHYQHAMHAERDIVMAFLSILSVCLSVRPIKRMEIIVKFFMVC